MLGTLSLNVLSMLGTLGKLNRPDTLTTIPGVTKVVAGMTKTCFDVPCCQALFWDSVERTAQQAQHVRMLHERLHIVRQSGGVCKERPEP